MTSRDLTGNTLDNKYKLTKLLGDGGMGSVYLGQHIIIGKKVAVKFLHIEYATNDEVVKRFYREAQAAAAIGHKNIIEVMDVGVSPEGEPYMVMEYLEGEDLDAMLKRTGSLSLEMAIGVMEPALIALEAAHQKGIIHRDLKPANIFIVVKEGEPPAVKLIDFGISKVTGIGDNTKLTQTGTLLGTPAYMSPEQARGSSDLDNRADVYSMAVILYQILTGKLPFKGDNYNELLINILTTSPRPPLEINSSFPMEAEGLVLKNLSKDPSDRSQSASEMLSELKSLNAYEKRNEGMTMLVSGITKRGVASGDLGVKPKTPGSTPSASTVLNELASQATPMWTENVQQTPSPTTQIEKAKSPWLVFGIVALALIVVLLIAGIFVLQSGNDKSSAVVPVQAYKPQENKKREPLQNSPKGNEVKIEVAGMPDGAKVYYDKAPVPMNPFTVEKKNSIVTLKVEAKGFEVFITSIVPSRDRVVNVELKPVETQAKKEPEKRSSKKRSKRSKKKEEEKKSVPKITEIKKSKSSFKVKFDDEKDKFQKGNRGTKFGQDFE